MIEMSWGSDAIAQLLHDLDLEYAALVPGSSYAGLHDSFVNYLGSDANPKLLVCLHEEHSIAIAHGYAKVTDRPMLAIVHANVGLMHATMAFYGAWCDRVPVIVVGANGPHDAAKRRPWIDWIHTSRDPASLVRHYTKWDDEPGSAEAALESILRAYKIATTAPFGPTYVVLDVTTQETSLPAPPSVPKLSRYSAPALPVPDPTDVEKVLEIMQGAKKPLIVIGRISRNLLAFNNRIALAEALGARVLTDFKAGVGFPTRHPLHVGRQAARLTTEGRAAFAEADAILSLEAIDLGGMVKQTFGDNTPIATIINCSIDHHIHNGWSMDHQSLPPADLHLSVGSDQLVDAMLAAIGSAMQSRPAIAPDARQGNETVQQSSPGGKLGFTAFCGELINAFAGRDVCYVRLPLGANDGSLFEFDHPLDYLGGDGGGGVGAGPGIAVGAALALRGTQRLPVAVLGDGDYLMGLTALWTAVANGIPLLVIVANNHCYNNDVSHQDRIARTRNRPVDRKWIGQMIADPAPDLAALARGQGAIGIGRIERGADLRAAIAEGIRHVEAGNVCVIDVYVLPDKDETS